MFHTSPTVGKPAKLYRLLGLLLAFLIAGGALLALNTAGPAHAATSYLQPALDQSSAVQYANSHWNCGDAACSFTVSAGSGQNGFQCAEFVARALAAEGLMPGLSTNSSQSAYGSYRAANGKTYNLLWVGYAAPFDGVRQYLLDNKLATDIHNNPSQASAGDPVMYAGPDGLGHMSILVSMNGSNSLVDQHNVAEKDINYNEYPSSTDILHIGDADNHGGANACPSSLSNGSTGTWVSVLQYALNSYHQNSGLSTTSPARWTSPLATDGQFGPQTQAAVVDFQFSSYANLGSSGGGVVGNRTWALLGFCEGFSSSTGRHLGPTGSTSESSCPANLSNGSNGVWSQALQSRLNYNYYYGFFKNTPRNFQPYLAVDGQFGSLTESAVVDYQFKVGLGSSGGGVAGNRTWSELGMCH